jgi:hypothetical protein
MAGRPPRRIIPLSVFMDTQATQPQLALFANSRDILQVCLKYANGDHLDLSQEHPTGVNWTPVVTVVPGADLLTGVAIRSKSATGITVPVDNDTTGMIEIEIQATDFTEAMATDGAWLELYLKSDEGTPTYQLAALFRINVVANLA